MATAEQLRHQDLRIWTPVDAVKLDAWIASKVSYSEKKYGNKSLMRGMGAAFVQAANDSRLNPIYLVAHAGVESAWGASPIVHQKRNFFGIGAYDSSPMESAKTWSSVQQGIIGGAVWISNNYTKAGQDTLYKMRWWATNPKHQYATDELWDSNIAAAMYAGYQAIGLQPNPGSIKINTAPEDYVERMQSLSSSAGVGQAATSSLTEVPDSTILSRKPQGIPGSYYDDDWSGLGYRNNQDTSFMRIGDSRFVIPPTQIRVTETSSVQTLGAVRQKQSIKTQSGSTIKQIEITLFFTDYGQINGYPIPAPGGKTYYMDGFRGFMAQMRTMPFLPVENELLNEVHDIYAVAILDIGVETMPGFPGVLKAEVTLLEYDTHAFLGKPSYTYDMHFMWPLYRWHYQHKLDGYTYTNDKFRPFDKGQAFSFWLLKEDALKKYEQKIFQDNQKKLDPGERAASWFDFNNIMDQPGFSDEWILPNDMVMISASASAGVTYAPLTLPLVGRPTYQYMGGQDTRFNLVFQTDSKEALQSILKLKAQSEKLAREYRDRFVSSAIRIDNNFVNMLGVNYVLMENVVSETIPGSPGVFYIMISLISYDPTQYKDESLDYLGEVNKAGDSTKTKNDMLGFDEAGVDNFIIQEVAAEMALNQLELYPDLGLPTYDEVNGAIKEINRWRKAKKLTEMPVKKLEPVSQARFVDPDFFFSYPTFEDLAMNIIPEAYVDVNDSITKELKALLKDKDTDAAAGEKMNLLTGFEDLGFDDPAIIKGALDKVRGAVVDPKAYAEMFLIPAWGENNNKERGEWKQASKSISGNPSVEVAYYHRKAAAISQEALASQRLIGKMMHDRYKYDRHNTMLRAFPSYVLVLIDEGKWVNSKRFWDKYYTYHAVSNISVHMDRQNPVHVAHIELSNIYNSLGYTSRIGRFKAPKIGYMERIWEQWFRDVRAEEIAERNRVTEAAQLMAGARVHLRLGYGSAATDLPPVINGTITEIDQGDIVSIVVQSDGHELTSILSADPNDSTSMFAQGFEPNEIFRYYLTDRKNNFLFTNGYGTMNGFGEITNKIADKMEDSLENVNLEAVAKFYRKTTNKISTFFEKLTDGQYMSTYGIEHFGYLRQTKESRFWDIANYFDNGVWGTDDYDIFKNIYLTTHEVKDGTAGVSRFTEMFDAELDLARDAHKANKTATAIHARRLGPAVDVTDFGIIDADTYYKARNAKIEAKNITKQKEITAIGVAQAKNMTPINKIESLLHVRWAMALYETNPKTGAKRSQATKDLIYKAIITYITQDIVLWQGLGEMVAGFNKSATSYKVLFNIGQFSSAASSTNFPMKKWMSDMEAIAKEYATPAANVRKQETITVMDDSMHINADEMNIQMYLHNKSPWDVFRVLERITPEYIVYPHIHNFHYTLFFGKPWWDVNCGYILPPGAQGDKLKEYKELRKPFAQSHIFNAYEDILHNGIKASAANLITTVVPLYNMNGEQQGTDPVWADYSIRSSFQKNQVVDTTIIGDIPFMPGLLNSLMEFAANKLSRSQVTWQRHAIRYGAAVVAESFRSMYQGELVVIGEPSIKPYDFMYINDYYTRMTGNAEAGKVTHHFGIATGFVTSIKPDLSVAVRPYLDEDRGSTAQADDQTQGLMKMLPEKLVIAGNVASTGVAAGYVAWRSWQAIKAVTATKAAKDIITTSRAATGIIAGTRAVAGTAGRAAAGWIGRIIVGQAAIPGAGWVSLLITTALYLGVKAVVNMVEDMFLIRYKNSIKIHPLFVKDVPFTAGINGHKHLIPGWYDPGDGHSVKIENVAVQKAQELYEINGRPYYVDDGSLSTGDTASEGDSFLGQSLKGSPVFWPMITRDITKTSVMYTAARISSPFGNRIHPITGKEKLHRGLDITPAGTNNIIVPMFAGTVVHVSASTPSYGTVVMVHHTAFVDGGVMINFVTLYGHSDISKTPAVGSKVTPQTILAYMDKKGDVTGIHLHFEIAIRKSTAKPFPAMPVAGSRVQDANRIGQAWYDYYMAEMNVVDPKDVLLKSEAGYQYSPPR